MRPVLALAVATGLVLQPRIGNTEEGEAPGSGVFFRVAYGPGWAWVSGTVPHYEDADDRVDASGQARTLDLALGAWLTPTLAVHASYLSGLVPNIKPEEQEYYDVVTYEPHALGIGGTLQDADGVVQVSAAVGPAVVGLEWGAEESVGSCSASDLGWAAEAMAGAGFDVAPRWSMGLALQVTALWADLGAHLVGIEGDAALFTASLLVTATYQ
jgi:hypothetical protein